MKKLIHIDADCFYAALEIRENARLQNLPVAVGGDPGCRGVIATCNYVARRYGVRSAMASAYALRLCPALQIVKPNFELYRDVSQQMHLIFSEYTEMVEPLGLDEAYLDVSESDFCRGSATLMAEEIRQRIRRELGITVSAGIAPVKFLAKIASDWRKPDGCFTVPPGKVEEFTLPLPLRCLPGVGKVTAEKLARFGLYHCRDVLAFDADFLRKHFGSFAGVLLLMCQGRDDRVVCARAERKSVSIERTFVHDLDTAEQMMSNLPELLGGLQQRYQKISTKYAVGKKFVKLKFDNFVQTTKEMTISQASDPYSVDDFRRLVYASWQRQKRSIRLLGVGFRLQPTVVHPLQLTLPFQEGGSESS